MPTVNEIERRFLVKEIDLKHRALKDNNVWNGCEVHLTQGYLDIPGSMRVRSYTFRGTGLQRHELTRKTGKGLLRVEQNADISAEAAQMLLGSTPFTISKTRRMCDGWEVDFFHGRLEGLIMAEKELQHPDEPCPIPPWIADAVEVTDFISNKQLARAAFLLSSDEPLSILDARRLRRVVLTGAPCSGKSAFVEQFRGTPGFHCVPEVATIVMGQLNVMPESGAASFQRTLYRMQHLFEDAAEVQAQRDGNGTVVIDRGSLDGAAFMPGGLDEYTTLVQTDALSELGRYDAVIFLRLPPRDVWERNRANNAIRRETWEQALVLEERLLDVWSRHPNLIVVGGRPTWEERFADIIGHVSCRL